MGEGEVALVVCLSPGRLLLEANAALCLWARAWGGCFGERRRTAAGASAQASASQSCCSTEHYNRKLSINLPSDSRKRPLTYMENLLIRFKLVEQIRLFNGGYFTALNFHPS